MPQLKRKTSTPNKVDQACFLGVIQISCRRFSEALPILSNTLPKSMTLNLDQVGTFRLTLNHGHANHLPYIGHNKVQEVQNRRREN
jgi:hypothetical protein